VPEVWTGGGAQKGAPTGGSPPWDGQGRMGKRGNQVTRQDTQEKNGSAGPGDAGDLGRRVAFRRAELGATREQVAALAGMSPGYLDYLEEHPAKATPASLARLAAALETSVGYLLGEGMSLPPGRGHAAARPVLEVLGREECDLLLAPGGVGRVVFADERGPVALPVNFAVLEGDIVFRTGPAASAAADRERSGFEVDQIDAAMREGWSVLVTGHARHIVEHDELARAVALGIEPWVGGQRDVYVRLQPEAISGRRIRALI